MPMFGFADPDPAGDDEVIDTGSRDDGAVRDEVGAALVNILPWGVSIVFHAGLVLMAIFVVWSTVVSAGDQQVIVPLVRLSATPGAPLEMTQSQRVQSSSSERRTVKPAPSRSVTPVEMKVDVPTLIGIEGAMGASRVNFGSAIDVGSGFKASFFGSGGNARRIVFLVDATGSLIDTFPLVIRELKKTVQQLSERQQFTIIFFTGSGPVEVPPVGLKPANAQIKAQVIDWIDLSHHNVELRGSANPVEALRRGLGYRPELVFLLSDNITGRGQYEVNQEHLLAEIQRANTHHTKINTIQFVYRDPLASAGVMGTMELIAKQSGGLYKFVDAKELNIR